MEQAPSDIAVDFDAESGRLALRGALTVQQFTQAQILFEQLEKRDPAIAQVDLRELVEIDTNGAFLLSRWLHGLPITYRDARQKSVVSFISGFPAAEPVSLIASSYGLKDLFVALGRFASEMKVELYALLTFTGKSAVMLARAARRPAHVRWGAVAQHIERIGIHALPIIGLMAFLIAIVLAYQGVAQLRPYGGEQFTVNLVALSILREMGVLLTAIMVAGRSGSSFTAEIGVMKAREEVDALQVMGFDPFAMLVTPRLIAIVIAVPLLTFYANIMGLTGGFLIINSLTDISFTQYVARLHGAVSGKDLFVGMVKAPVFAFFIGLIGCMRGLRVSSSAESIGRETTASVVASIFLVLVLDAFFSIFFEKVGL